MELTIISPKGILLHEEVESVTLPGKSGSFTVLKDHAPIISALVSGFVSYSSAGRDDKYEITGGIAEVDHNKIRILI